MMHGQALSREIVGIVGNVISGFLFASPLPTYIRIWKNKNTEEFHPYPYLATVLNCLCWIFYGLPIVHPDSTLVITINGAGLVLELFYLAVFFYYTKKPKYRVHIILVLLGELVLVAAIAVFTLLCFHTHKKRSMVVGIICDIFGIIMYGSPLSNLYDVYVTKSAEFMPVWLCLVGFINGFVWLAYACLKSFDPYIAAGNGIGGILGLIQLSVFAYYTWIYPWIHKGKKPGAVKEDVVKPAELQNVV